MIQDYEVVQETPWSNVFRFSTVEGVFYLKQTPPDLFLESSILRYLKTQFDGSIPEIIAINSEYHCFLMKDAGFTLRQYLKSDFQSNLLCQAIRKYGFIQRSVEHRIEPLFELGVPDWRIENFPKLYDQLIRQTDLLLKEGMVEEDLESLHDLRSLVSEQCNLLFQYKISETLVQPDFNTNNMLYNPSTKEMTLIDLGEIVISHPFFSMPNFLVQAKIHHGISEQDPLYCQLQDIYFESWLEFFSKKQLQEMIVLIKQLCPIYGALAYYRLMMNVDIQVLKSYYGNKPSRLAEQLKQYIIQHKSYL